MAHKAFPKPRKLAEGDVIVMSGAIVIEAGGCAEPDRPQKTEKPQKDPWDDFDHELKDKIRSRELEIDPKTKEIIKKEG